MKNKIEEKKGDKVKSRGRRGELPRRYMAKLLYG